MDIAGEYRISAARENVWAALNDPDVLERCIPGCEAIERTSDTEMQARVVAAVGPVKARFNTRLTLENLNPPESYRLNGDAKAGATGFGRGSADVTLTDEGDATLLSYRASFKVGGKLAQVGARLVEGATRKTADQFFGNLSRELGASEEDGEVADAAPSTPGAGRVLLLAGAVAAVLVALWYLLR